MVLKRWLKDVRSREPGRGNKNQRLNAAVGLLVQKVEAQAAFVVERRKGVEFAPDRREGVENFLSEVELEKTPLGAFVVGMRKQREEREMVVEEGRRSEEERKEEGVGKKVRGKTVTGRMNLVESGSEDEDEEVVDGEERDEDSE